MSERNYWTKLGRRAMSRRTLLRASARAGVGAAGLALVGCGDDDDDGQQTVAQAQQQAMQQPQAEQQAEQQAQQQQAQTATAEEQQEDEQAAQAADSEPKRGGVVTFAGWDGGIFDPAIANHGGTDSNVLSIYDQLNYLDEGGVLTSAMAELPEVVDELNFIYTIKPNVRGRTRRR